MNYDVACALAPETPYNLLSKPLVSSNQLYDINFLDNRDYDWPVIYVRIYNLIGNIRRERKKIPERNGIIGSQVETIKSCLYAGIGE